MTEPKFDIEILGKGVYVITGTTIAGGAWLLENVPDARVNGSEATADCEGGNMAQSIADGAISKGFAVAVNGLKYLGGNTVEKE
jgi:hypothetical protein